jgi:phosphate-selective porin OprO/OprP
VRNGVACACLGLLLLAGLAAARAEESGPTAREKELEQRVWELEKRVLELEKLIQRLGGTEQPDPEQRVRKEGERLAQQDKPGTLRAYWKDGLRFETDDGAFKLEVGGRIQNDWAFMTADGTVEERFGAFEDGTEFRRARLYVSGELYDHLIFKTQYDFAATGDADFKDVYVGLKELPVLGNVKVGHYKEPFGLERLGSSKYLTFLERGLPNAFAPSRNTGIMFYDAECDERMTWALGVFRDTDAFGRNRADGKYSVTGRLTALALYEDEGRELLHVGVGGTATERLTTTRFASRSGRKRILLRGSWIQATWLRTTST